MNDLDKLVSRAAGRLFVAVRIDEMGADMVLKHYRQEPIHRAAATGYLLQDVDTPLLLLERPLDRFDLPLDAPDPVEQLLFSRMVWLINDPPYTWGEYTSDRVEGYIK